KFYTYDDASAAWIEANDLTAFAGASSPLTLALTDPQNPAGAVSETVAFTPPPRGTDIYAAVGPFQHNWSLPLAEGATRPATGNFPSLSFQYSLRGTPLSFVMN